MKHPPECQLNAQDSSRDCFCCDCGYPERLEAVLHEAIALLEADVVPTKRQRATVIVHARIEMGEEDKL